MPIYALGDARPDLPRADEYWVAPDAHVIGKVVLGEDVGIWFGACSAATTNGSPSARAPMCRKAR